MRYVDIKCNNATRFAGSLAVLAVLILQIPELGTKDVGDALEWVFFVVLPNFCFSKALQDLLTKFQYSNICSQIDEQVDRTTFCALMRSINTTNPCCPGELRYRTSLS